MSPRTSMDPSLACPEYRGLKPSFPKSKVWQPNCTSGISLRLEGLIRGFSSPCPYTQGATWCSFSVYRWSNLNVEDRNAYLILRERTTKARRNPDGWTPFDGTVYQGKTHSSFQNVSVESWFLHSKQGKIYDSPESAESISSFVKTYDLKTDELLEPDLTKYKCFNDFFSRCAACHKFSVEWVTLIPPLTANFGQMHVASKISMILQVFAAQPTVVWPSFRLLTLQRNSGKSYSTSKYQCSWLISAL